MTTRNHMTSPFTFLTPRSSIRHNVFIKQVYYPTPHTQRQHQKFLYYITWHGTHTATKWGSYTPSTCSTYTPTTAGAENTADTPNRCSHLGSIWSGSHKQYNSPMK